MLSRAASDVARPQNVLNAYFREHSAYWAEIYQREGIKEATHQERLRAALAMADALQLPPGARVLDAGCGAGYATVALASRRFSVDALDPVQAMVDATRHRVVAAGMQVDARSGDVHALPFPDGTFDLVLALGVLPWLPSLEPPLREMARVLRPGGHLIVSVDCRWQLRQALDPLRTPLLQWLKELVRYAVPAWRRHPGGARSHVTSLRGIRQALGAQGFDELRGVALGFGPFTFFDREILPRPAGLKLQHRLQSLANRGAPILRWSGSQYLVLARKRGSAIAG